MKENKEMEQHIEKLQMIDKVGKYTLFYDREDSSIAIYNGVEIHHANIVELGDAVFGKDE